MSDGEHRPAVIVKVWNKENGMVNLQVFTDGVNDGPLYESGLLWQTSVEHSDAKMVRTWHWPERE
ncbi:hypothetical protein EPN95_04555 [Patescibacteria group bacterium]|nr:MAG: hypothetical protein EPN95_04555 [Patescibacteria group bacterium]